MNEMHAGSETNVDANTIFINHPFVVRQAQNQEKTVSTSDSTRLMSVEDGFREIGETYDNIDFQSGVYCIINIKKKCSGRGCLPASPMSRQRDYQKRSVPVQALWGQHAFDKTYLC